MNTFDYNIFLIGFMGSGKSTVSRLLAQKLQRERLEMDQMIAEKEGMSIPEIFARHGEDYFRDLESQLLIELQNDGHAVVSCGGGIIVRDRNADYMRKNGRIVFLTADPETIYERVKNSTDRPILNQNMSVEYIAELMEQRRARYEAAADLRVATDHKTTEEICDEIIRSLRSFDAEQKQNASEQ